MSVILDELYKLGGNMHEGSYVCMYVWRLIRDKRPDSVTTATPDKLLRNQRSAESKQRAALGPCLSMWSDWLDSCCLKFSLVRGVAPRRFSPSSTTMELFELEPFLMG